MERKSLEMEKRMEGKDQRPKNARRIRISPQGTKMKIYFINLCEY